MDKTKYPEELVIVTDKTSNGIAWGIRDEKGQFYNVPEAKDLWFGALKDEVDIDSNLTFARLVERNFDARAFDDYIQNR